MSLTHIINFLKQVDELEQGKQLLNVFAKYSNSLEQFDQLGMLYEKVKAYRESLQMLEKCLVFAKTPEQLHSVRANLAKVYNHLNEPQKSLFYSTLNVQLNPNDYEALMEQSFSHYLNGDSDLSYKIQVELMENPNVPEEVKKRITFNMGTFELSQGNFKTGVYMLIGGGKDIGIWPTSNKPYPKWQGEQTDKTVLVYAEAGIGDEIIDIRLMSKFKERGIKALWVGIRKDIVDLFKRNGFNCILEKELDPFEEYVYCTAMSLPILLDLDKTELWDGPYLSPDPEYIEKWRKILPEKFITVKWSGNPYYDQDLHRSLDIDLLSEKLESFNIPIVSLQIDTKDERFINVDIESWEDTLAIQHLALLNITSCTSTAHSASAIGSRCVVLPPIATYYTWLDLQDDTSRWYGENTKVYPQKTWRDWKPTINKCIEHLNTLL